MSFVQPITVKEAMDKIDKREFLLPAIQREFVWNPNQIESLFDSLMKGYPIGSFLFWDVPKSSQNDYQFYDFIRDYHERDNYHNTKANVSGYDSVTAVLDGQQRLTALYIGLKGSYAYKTLWKRWDNNTAFPKRKLYLNLLGGKPSAESDYEFSFLTDEAASQNDETHYWFPVSDIFTFENTSDCAMYGIQRFNGNPNLAQVVDMLGRLFTVVFTEKAINFFLEQDASLDKVLNIFIRVNSGGTKLSYSDLLLSIATAQWTTMDAREEITQVVDDINKHLGSWFDVNKDFILKSCLVLCDFSDIAFKVDNFNKKNMAIIESKWTDIIQAIKAAYCLIGSFGYDADTLPSNNAVIPIAYYLYKIGCPVGFVNSSYYQSDRSVIKKFLIISLLKRNFSGQPDNVLKAIREVIQNDCSSGFPLKGIIDRQKGTNKTYTFDDEEIEFLFSYQYGKSYTFSVLALLYPGLDYRNKFHMDHIYPKTKFKVKTLEKAGISDVDFYMSNFNYLANLQLLEGVPNEEKSCKNFEEWLNEVHPIGSASRDSYLANNYIPTGISYGLDNFEEFIEKRKELMLNSFKKLVN